MFSTSLIAFLLLYSTACIELGSIRWFGSSKDAHLQQSRYLQRPSSFQHHQQHRKLKQTVSDSVPFEVNGAPDADTTIATGSGHTCAISVDSKLYCWGLGTSGQLGDGLSTTSRTPVQVSGDSAWAQITAGYHTCALTTSRVAFCWGFNGAGEVGDGTNVDKPVPTMVKGDYKWSEVSAGFRYTCGVTVERGELLCWGAIPGRNMTPTAIVDDDDNADGISNSLRPGTWSKDTSEPVRLGGEGWKSISSGYQHVCGIKSNGSAYCFGDNSFGELGVEGVITSKEPVLVTGPQGEDIKWRKITAGEAFSCGITVTGRALCWGSNEDYQLGTGTEDRNMSTPFPVGGDLKWIQISAGDDFVCGLTVDRLAYCWGDTEIEGKAPRLVISDVVWNQVRVGDDHACGISLNGTLACWGENESGQFGSSSSQEASKVPIFLDDGNAWRIQQKVVLVPEAFDPNANSNGILPPPNGMENDGGDDGDAGNNNSNYNDGYSNYKGPYAGSSNMSSGSTSSDDGDGDGTNIGAIIGGVIGGLAVIAATATIAWTLAKRREASKISAVQQQTQMSLNTKQQPLLPMGFKSLIAFEDDPLLAFISSQPSSKWREWRQATLSSDSTSIKAASVGPDTLNKTRPLDSLDLGTKKSSGLVDISPWEFDISEIEVLESLGSGSFGRVYKAKWRETTVAIKILLDVGNGNETLATAAIMQDKLLQEAGLMASLRHPNIVTFLGFSMAPPCVATELCARGSLYQLLQEGLHSHEAAKVLTWKRRLNMITDAARGMFHLHSCTPQIIHNDLKSPNLLVTTDYTVKVADFNLSKLVHEVTLMSVASSTAGGVTNPCWLAPEVLNNEPPTAASDVYSFGVVMWELLTWKLPWSHALNPWAVVTAVAQGQRLPIPGVDDLPGSEPPLPRLEGYIELMQRCWAQNPEERPKFQEIIQELRALE